MEPTAGRPTPCIMLLLRDHAPGSCCSWQIDTPQAPHKHHPPCMFLQAGDPRTPPCRHERPFQQYSNADNTLHYSSLPTEGPREGSFPLIYHRMHPSYFYTLNNVFFGKQLSLLCERAPHTLVLPTPCQVLSGGISVSKLLPLCHISQKCACLQKMLFIAILLYYL